MDVLAALLRRAERLTAAMAEKEGDAERLRRSVIRPLAGIVDADDAEPADSPGDDDLWRLTIDATRALTMAPAPAPAALLEAVAALQGLSLREDTDGTRLAELRVLTRDLPTQIRCSRNGPYLVTSAEHLRDWLGLERPASPVMALCRCGASATKPFCDGAHAENGFSDAKDPGRVPDRREEYVGQQITVFDNRGICQHSGFCTDRLPTVFRQGEEPFVAPSGGRMDEIMRAVRDCPSGALSMAVDGAELRSTTDHAGRRAPAIEVSRDGPYRVTGFIPLLDAEGSDEPRADGASREHYALCRCGHSQNKPFCSGAHWYADFHDPLPDPEQAVTIFEWAGGLPALTRMTRIFYERYVPQEPLLAPLFARMSPDHPQLVAAWLAEVFCGPKIFSTEHGGYSRMLSQHIGKGLTEEKRAAWVRLLLRSAQDAGLPTDPEFRSAFNAYIEWGSRLAVENSQAGAHPPQHMPMPHWDWSTAAGPPGSRVSALAPVTDEEAEHPVVLPHPDEPVSFERHVRTFFRQRDRQSMKGAFDLWSYDDVVRHAHKILERVRDGSMPCDGAWPEERVAALDRWTCTGMRP